MDHLHLAVGDLVDTDQVDAPHRITGRMAGRATVVGASRR